MNRIHLIFLLLAWLMGDSVFAASVAPPAKPTLESTAAAHTPKPLVIPAAKAAVKTSSKVQPAAAKPAGKTPASKAQTKNIPAKKVQVRKAPPAKSSASGTKARQTTKAKPSAASAKKAKLAPVKLNLSLPPELLEKIHFGQPVAESSEASLLPPLFVEDKPEPSRYQLSGKLISNERQRSEQDNYLDGFDGAELSIEYRQ
jgi:hypothetical protein